MVKQCILSSLSESVSKTDWANPHISAYLNNIRTAFLASKSTLETVSSSLQTTTNWLNSVTSMIHHCRTLFLYCARFYREISKGVDIWNWVCNEKRSDPCIFTVQIETNDRKRGQRIWTLL